MSLSRREFLRRSASAAGALALPGVLGASLVEPEMPTRPLGNLGFRASIYGIGTGELPEGPAAVQAIRTLLDGGVNFIDTAPSYQGGRSETQVGQALRGRRDRVFVATKTGARDADAAVREVRASLGRLGLARVDLLMVHGVNDNAALDAVLRRGGAVEGLERARREGLIRHIGISGHTCPDVILRAMREYPFASILVPVSAMDAHLSDFATECIPYAQRRGLGVIGMKALKGMERATRGRFEAADLLRYALSLPIDTLAIGLRRPEEAEQNLQTCRRFRPMPARERAALEARVKPLSDVGALWWKRR